jgi:hypothetical protein
MKQYVYRIFTALCHFSVIKIIQGSILNRNVPKQFRKFQVYYCMNVENPSRKDIKNLLVFKLLSAILQLLVAKTWKLMVRLLAVAWPA